MFGLFGGSSEPEEEQRQGVNFHLYPDHAGPVVQAYLQQQLNERRIAEQQEAQKKAEEEAATAKKNKRNGKKNGKDLKSKDEKKEETPAAAPEANSAIIGQAPFAYDLNLRAFAHDEGNVHKGKGEEEQPSPEEIMQLMQAKGKGEEAALLQMLMTKGKGEELLQAMVENGKGDEAAMLMQSMKGMKGGSLGAGKELSLQAQTLGKTKGKGGHASESCIGTAAQTKGKGGSRSQGTGGVPTLQKPNKIVIPRDRPLRNSNLMPIAEGEENESRTGSSSSTSVTSSSSSSAATSAAIFASSSSASSSSSSSPPVSESVHIDEISGGGFSGDEDVREKGKSKADNGLNKLHAKSSTPLNPKATRSPPLTSSDDDDVHCIDAGEMGDLQKLMQASANPENMDPAYQKFLLKKMKMHNWLTQGIIDPQLAALKDMDPNTIDPSILPRYEVDARSVEEGGTKDEDDALCCMTCGLANTILKAFVCPICPKMPDGQPSTQGCGVASNINGNDMGVFVYCTQACQMRQWQYHMQEHQVNLFEEFFHELEPEEQTEFIMQHRFMQEQKFLANQYLYYEDLHDENVVKPIMDLFKADGETVKDSASGSSETSSSSSSQDRKHAESSLSKNGKGKGKGKKGGDQIYFSVDPMDKHRMRKKGHVADIGEILATAGKGPKVPAPKKEKRDPKDKAVFIGKKQEDAKSEEKRVVTTFQKSKEEGGVNDDADMEGDTKDGDSRDEDVKKQDSDSDDTELDLSGVTDADIVLKHYDPYKTVTKRQYNPFFVTIPLQKTKWIKKCGFLRHEWFVDCYRLRCGDDTEYGGAFKHGMYATECSTGSVIRDFFMFVKLSKRHGLLPTELVAKDTSEDSEGAYYSCEETSSEEEEEDKERDESLALMNSRLARNPDPGRRKKSAAKKDLSRYNYKEMACQAIHLLLNPFTAEDCERKYGENTSKIIRAQAIMSYGFAVDRLSNEYTTEQDLCSSLEYMKSLKPRIDADDWFIDKELFEDVGGVDTWRMFYFVFGMYQRSTEVRDIISASLENMNPEERKMYDASGRPNVFHEYVQDMWATMKDHNEDHYSEYVKYRWRRWHDGQPKSNKKALIETQKLFCDLGWMMGDGVMHKAIFENEKTIDHDAMDEIFACSTKTWEAAYSSPGYGQDTTGCMTREEQFKKHGKGPLRSTPVGAYAEAAARIGKGPFAEMFGESESVHLYCVGQDPNGAQVWMDSNGVCYMLSEKTGKLHPVEVDFLDQDGRSLGYNPYEDAVQAQEMGKKGIKEGMKAGKGARSTGSASGSASCSTSTSLTGKGGKQQGKAPASGITTTVQAAAKNAAGKGANQKGCKNQSLSSGTNTEQEKEKGPMAQCADLVIDTMRNLRDAKDLRDQVMETGEKQMEDVRDSVMDKLIAASESVVGLYKNVVEQHPIHQMMTFETTQDNEAKEMNRKLLETVLGFGTSSSKSNSENKEDAAKADGNHDETKKPDHKNSVLAGSPNSMISEGDLSSTAPNSGEKSKVFTRCGDIVMKDIDSDASSEGDNDDDEEEDSSVEDPVIQQAAPPGDRKPTRPKSPKRRSVADDKSKSSGGSSSSGTTSAPDEEKKAEAHDDEVGEKDAPSTKDSNKEEDSSDTDESEKEEEGGMDRGYNRLWNHIANWFVETDDTIYRRTYQNFNERWQNVQQLKPKKDNKTLHKVYDATII